jgi:hypothetical protein
MDSQASGILGIFGFLVSMGGAIYAAINHKKIRCRCCGKDLDVSVDVDSTEPVPTSEPKDEEVAPEQRRGSIHDDDKDVERKHYRKTRVVPLRPPPPPPPPPEEEL